MKFEQLLLWTMTIYAILNLLCIYTQGNLLHVWVKLNTANQATTTLKQVSRQTPSLISNFPMEATHAIHCYFLHMQLTLNMAFLIVNYNANV